MFNKMETIKVLYSLEDKRRDILLELGSYEKMRSLISMAKERGDEEVVFPFINNMLLATKINQDIYMVMEPSIKIEPPKTENTREEVQEKNSGGKENTTMKIQHAAIIEKVTKHIRDICSLEADGRNELFKLKEDGKNDVMALLVDSMINQSEMNHTACSTILKQVKESVKTVESAVGQCKDDTSRTLR